ITRLQENCEQSGQIEFKMKQQCLVEMEWRSMVVGHLGGVVVGPMDSFAGRHASPRNTCSPPDTTDQSSTTQHHSSLLSLPLDPWHRSCSPLLMTPSEAHHHLTLSLVFCPSITTA